MDQNLHMAATASNREACAAAALTTGVPEAVPVAETSFGGMQPLPSLARMPSAADYTPIAENDAFDSRLQAIKARATVTDKMGQRPGPFICAFTPKCAAHSCKMLNRTRCG